MLRFFPNLVGSLWLVLCCLAHPAAAQPKLEELADDPQLFLETARKFYKWDEPADPAHLCGPIYFVGTKGLCVYLITTSEGHLVINTGMPGSGPLIEKSIRKLGFKPEEIKLLLIGHAHVDHAGGHAYLKKLSGAQIATIRQEKELLESGGQLDFHYGTVREFQFEPARVDRVFDDGDEIKLGDFSIKALLTAGHTRGSTTFITTISEGNKTYSVAFPNGTSINPGYRLLGKPSYPKIADDFRRTLDTLESLKPDIWLMAHTEAFHYDVKLARAATDGVQAWVDFEGYQKWIKAQREKYEATLARERGAAAKQPNADSPKSISAQNNSRPENSAIGDRLVPASMTPAQIADGIERAMRQYNSAEYQIEYTEARNTAPLFGKEPPRWLKGEGRVLYRTDGDRWFLNETAPMHNSGDKALTTEHRISGFDGKEFYHFRNERAFVRGEDDLGKDRAHLPHVLWRAAKNAESLLWCLRHRDAKVIDRPEIDGHRCLVVELKWIPEYDTTRTSQRMQTTISPEQSFLPLKTVWERADAVVAECELRGLTKTTEGIWYPLMIRTNQNFPNPSPFSSPKIERLKSVQIRNAESKRDWQDSDFEMKLPWNVDIFDRPSGTAWHNDPWWNEMAEWIKTEFNWPRAGTGELISLGSFCDPSMQNQPAPQIQAAEWIAGKDPGAWDRSNRLITVLYFFGNRLIDPHPKLTAALKSWSDRYRDDGVELLGIASQGNAEEIKRLVNSLKINFPVAIDQTSEKKGSSGRTHDDFQLQGYMGVVVVDPAGRVRLVEPNRNDPNPVNQLDAVVLEIFAEAGQKPKWAGDDVPHAERFQDMHPALTDEAVQAIFAEWRRRAHAATGQGRITGTISATAQGKTVQPIVVLGGKITATPQFRMLNSDIPGGWMLDEDRGRSATVETSIGGAFEFDKLCKGTYQLKFSAVGYATIEKTVALGTNDSELTIDVVMVVDTIGGIVVDERDRPIPNAKIKPVLRHLAPPGKHPSTTADLPKGLAFSDAEGKFRFSNLLDSAYTFEITADGFESTLAEIISLGTSDLKVVMKQSQ